MNRIPSTHQAELRIAPQQSRDPRVSIIVISYNAKNCVEDCLAALSLDTQPFQVIVIDNHSIDGTRSLLARMDDYRNRITVILNDENIGFGKACNQGAALSHGEYLLFLNPDAVAEADVIARMATYLDDHPDIAVVGPQVRMGNGAVQLSCGRNPTLYYRLLEALRLSQLSPQLFGGYRYSAWNHSESKDVDWVSGCCLMVRAKAFHDVAGFDENFFLFEEDVDLCLRIVEGGDRVVYWPEVAVYHARGQSSKSVRAFSALVSYRAKLYFARKYGRRLEWTVLKCLFPVISLAKSIAAATLARTRDDPTYREAARSHIRVAIALILGRDLKPDIDTEDAPVERLDPA